MTLSLTLPLSLPVWVFGVTFLVCSVRAVRAAIRDERTIEPNAGRLSVNFAVFLGAILQYVWMRGSGS